ncbi:MAG: methylated-DNA--[protein]-cysteine S-methyltransferase [Candidatus Hydrogenedens sp.]|nr:methylated-DNA--[protein]-cysteine S-methyltransferase [Candidatus Hydrogenedens sp.]
MDVANFIFKKASDVIYGYISSKGLQKLYLYHSSNPRPYLLHETPNILLGRHVSFLLDRYFSGIPEQFEGLPLDLSSATEFQKKIFYALRKVPWGNICSYSELAKMAHLSQNHARAVGQALHKNPLPIIIPCHRVLTAKGHIGGFSAGLEWKRKLLKLEGISIQG